MVFDCERLTLRETVREVLVRSKRGRSRLSARDAESALLAATSADYGYRLRQLFDRRQAAEIVRDFSKALPGLNVEIMREIEPIGLARVAARLGATFNAMPFDFGSRSGLRGFYVRPAEGIKKPLICVNAATHPVAMASSFWHELGHHLSARLFDDRRSEFALSFTSDYQSHLDDPAETAADMVSVLAAYPRVTAAGLFEPWLRRGMAPDIDGLVGTLRPHLQAVSGFDFERRFSAVQNMRYLSAMIHFGNLRWSMLSQFNI